MTNNTSDQFSVFSFKDSYSKTSSILGLLVIAPVPTIGVWFAAFDSNGELGSVIWALAKVWMVLGPLIWWLFVQRQPVKLPTFKLAGMGVGLASSLVLAAIIISSYWIFGRNNIDFSPMRAVLDNVGIDNAWKYLGLALYLTLINSLVEEYVFRWFMYKQLSRLVTPLVAVFFCGIIFTIHHTVVLTAYIPWYFNVLASLGVLSGGLIWSYLYYKYGRIWPAFLSHIGADIGVFIIGYDALFLN